jgi:predicted nuclease of predicted toxin-antitoxin system
MRILLDENLPKRLKGELGGHELWTVREKRWAGKKNGELLALAIQDSFDVFITADQNIQYQHNLANYAIIVVFLVAKDNTLERLKPLMTLLLEGLESAKRGETMHISEPDDGSNERSD